MPDGESLHDVRERAIPVINQLVKEFNTEGIAVVAHRVVNKVLICALLGLDNSCFWNIRQDTCGITSFNYEQGRFILNKHNETSYLEALHSNTLA